MKEKTCIVIGGGMGGLFTGALLAHDGYRVTVLEKNMSIGGGLQCFFRNGEKYETGMHIAGGFTSGGPLERICRYLGFSVDTVSNARLASVHFLSDDSVYDLPCGRKALETYLIEHFPDDESDIRGYIEAIYRLSEEESLFYMKAGHETVSHHSEEFMMSADAFIASYLKNPKLRSLVAFLAPMYAGKAGHTPAYLHIMASVLFIDSACRFASGSDELAEKLASVIRVTGGDVIPSAEVVRVNVTDRYILSVETSDGRVFASDNYVSDIHPRQLLNLMPEGSLPRAYASRLREIPLTCSAFKVYVRPSVPVKYISYPTFVYRDIESVWKLSHADDWPHGVSCFMTPSIDGTASHITLLSPMSFEEVSRWKDAGRGKRGTGYVEWKDAKMRAMLKLAETVFPELSEAESFAATPLTFRDWYGTSEGSIYGYAKDCENPALSRLSVRTKVANLFLTGQNVNMHGIGGVPMTAIETAEAVEGSGELRNKISEI